MNTFSELEIKNNRRDNGQFAGPLTHRVCNATFRKSREYKWNSPEGIKWDRINSYLFAKYWKFKNYDNMSISSKEIETERRKIDKQTGEGSILQYIIFYREGRKIEADFVYKGLYWYDETNFTRYDVRLKISRESDPHNYTILYLDWGGQFSKKIINDYLTDNLDFSPLEETQPRGITDKKETVTQLSLF